MVVVDCSCITTSQRGAGERGKRTYISRIERRSAVPSCGRRPGVGLMRRTISSPLVPSSTTRRIPPPSPRRRIPIPSTPTDRIPIPASLRRTSSIPRASRTGRERISRSKGLISPRSERGKSVGGCVAIRVERAGVAAGERGGWGDVDEIEIISHFEITLNEGLFELGVRWCIVQECQGSVWSSMREYAHWKG